MSLAELRVRTPRLELRPATRAELLQLVEVARGGVHPPERTPFYHPWTDRAPLPEFVEEFLAHHERPWDPDDWTLHLVAFLDGRPIGEQTVRSVRFADTLTVDTGSWLGEPWQNRGLGTEMRAGALELAFRGLGAEAATSGAFADNPQSARVSEKLDYRQVGEREVAPRGAPVLERQYRLERTDWRSRFLVELAGVEGVAAIVRSRPDPPP